MVSIIIPMKNCAEHIENTINSVFAQSYKDWEMILINDNSDDDTERICQALRKEHSNIQYYLNDRSGVSAARNFGLQKAKGTYILFVDSDDLLRKESVDKRVALIERDKVDLGIFGYYQCLNGEMIQKKLFRQGMYKRNSFLERVQYFETGKMIGYEAIWDKIFRKNIIEKFNIKFDETLDKYEDSFFSLDYIEHSNNIAVYDYCAYDYYIRPKKQTLSKAADKDVFFMNDFYFSHIKKILENQNVFHKKVRDGFYHGYINKIIGNIYLLKRNQEVFGIEIDWKILEYLFDNQEFLEALNIYKARNLHEDMGIINVLKKRDIGALQEYLDFRLKNKREIVDE